MANRIVKIAKGGLHKIAENDISYYAKNINTNAGGSVGETGDGGVVFGRPQSGSWEMPDVDFPDYSTSYDKVLPQNNSSNTPNALQNQNAPTEEVDEEESGSNKDKVKITVAVFFDGTGNNGYNTRARWFYKKRKYDKEVLSDLENEHADEYEGMIYGTMGNVWGGSFQNDLSNVARLEKFYDIQKISPTHFVSKVYVEGVGTQDGDNDDLTSAKDGEGVSGIREKIKSSITTIGTNIKDISGGKIIEELTFNVYGFSRGAATARNFVHEVTQEKGALKEKNFFRKDVNFDNKFGLLGEEIDTSKVEKMTINFAGLFDTVSAHDMDGIDKGIFEDAHDDVEELHLKAINKAKKVVHFVAEDEHRKNFALTTTSKGIQKYFPGVHSDVGGCYTNGKESVGVLLSDTPVVVKKEAKRLEIEGWYKSKQLNTSVISKEKDKDGKVIKVKKVMLSGTRLLSKNYSFIPLELMGKLSDAQTEIIIKLDELEKIYNIHALDPNRDADNKKVKELEAEQKKLLTYVKGRLSDYVLKNDTPMKFYSQSELIKRANDLEYINMKKDSDNLFVLRNQFLHFSSDYSVLSPGMSPNIENGKRKRKVFHG